MKQYKIGDQLKCIKDVETSYFEMTNPYFIIPKTQLQLLSEQKLLHLK